MIKYIDYGISDVSFQVLLCGKPNILYSGNKYDFIELPTYFYNKLLKIKWNIYLEYNDKNYNMIVK